MINFLSKLFGRARKADSVHASQYIEKGTLLLSSHQYSLAIADLDRAIRLDPENADPYFLRGVAYAKIGQNGRAIKDYSVAIRLNPKSADAYHTRGIAHSSEGKYDKAVADFDQAIRLKPDLAAAYNDRGSANLQTGDIQRAIDDYQSAIRIDPDYDVAQFNLASALARKSESDPSLDLFMRAVGHFQARDFDRAIVAACEAIRMSPDNADFYYLRGTAIRNLDLADAQDSAVFLNLPPLPTERDGIGMLKHLVERNNVKRRLVTSDYDHAIEIDPTHAGAHHNRGIVYAERGDASDYEQAGTDLLVAMTLDVEYRETYTEVFNKLGFGSRKVLVEACLARAKEVGLMIPAGDFDESGWLLRV